MKEKISVVVICGGQSTEHEVSVRSARSIIDALDKTKYEAFPIGITRKGQWLTGPIVENCLKTGDEIISDSGNACVLPDPTRTNLVNIEETDSSLTRIGKSKVVVFPVLHGIHGEDGTVQGLLELANLPYVGAGVTASALGMDKVKQKEILTRYKVPVCEFDWFRESDWSRKRDQIFSRLSKKFSPTGVVFVKPANAGSSVGISKAHLASSDEVVEAVNSALQFDHKIIIERAQNNAREIEVGVIGNEEPEASICGEIMSANDFYDYDAKYRNSQTQLVIPAKIIEPISRKIRNYAIQAFSALDCEGFARVDFFYHPDSEKIILNEVNTIPGFTQVSMFPKLWAATDLKYTQLVEQLIKLAFERWDKKQTIKYSMGDE